MRFFVYLRIGLISQNYVLTMAKGPLFIGTFTGKIGNVVGYTLKDSNDKVIQATRVYQPVVSNPRTEPQAIQRMKLAPAVNFYRQMSRILDNAWQGQRYGNRSRQYFMSLAMKQTTGIPFIVKGDKGFYPGEYPIAQGSLVQFNVTAIDSSVNLVTSIKLSSGYDFSGTWGEFSQIVINNNFGIVDGDKITVVAIDHTNGGYVPVFSYFILNTSSTALVDDVLLSSHFSLSSGTGDYLEVDFEGTSDVVAGGVILSRLQDGAWLRSNSTLFCTDAYKEALMGQEAYNASIASYTDAATYVSNWYLNEGIIGGENNYVPGGSSDGNLTIMSLSTVEVDEATNKIASIALMSDGTYRGIRSNTTPSAICVARGARFQKAGYLGSEWLATDANLALIATEAGKTLDGWIVVNADAAPNENETPEP